MTKTASRFHRFALPLVLVGFVAACGGGEKTPTELPSGPHPIVIVAIDGLRADRLGTYGAKDGRTPNLDALAKESVVFSWAFAQAPEGAPSLASLLTAFYPTTHHVRRSGDTLAPEARTLAEILSGAGYDTAAFVDGEGVTADLGFAQGFTVFEARSGAGLGQVGTRATAWMKERAAKNFLLLVEGSDPARSGGSYDGALAAADAFVGEFLKAFRGSGLDRRATLVVLGTHGVDLGEHPGEGGSSLQPTIVHVPVLIRFPGGARAHVVEEYVEVVDVGPTLLAAVGIPAHGGVHGRSLIPLIRGEGKPPYVAFGESPRGGGARYVAMGGYQLIHTVEGNRDEVYRLAEDPLGKSDVSAGEAQRIAVLAGHLEAWEKLASVASLDPEKQAAPLDDATLQKLKSLGYVQ